MSFSPLAGARGELGPGGRKSDESICEYRDSSFEPQRRNRVHHPLAQAGINFATGTFHFRRAKAQWFADDNCDRAKARSAAAAWQGIIGSENPHRHNRRESFRNHKTDASERRLKFSIEG